MAPPGHVLVSVDFDACELRTWSQACIWFIGHSKLAEILNDPKRCPHKEMGCRLWDSGGGSGQHYNASGATWRDQYAWVYDLKDKKLMKDVRGLAKGPNFGLPGGMGAERLVDYCYGNYGVVLTLELAQVICKVWREMYPEAQPYLDFVSRTIGKKRGARGKVEMVVSRRQRGDVGFTDASNGFFQGLASDLAKASGVALAKEAYSATSSPFYGARKMAFVHDEHIYAIKYQGQDHLHEAAYRMAKIQVDTAQAFCPDVLITASPAACFRWSKAAGDPVFDSQGRLLPFECNPKYDGPAPAAWHRDLSEAIRQAA